MCVDGLATAAVSHADFASVSRMFRLRRWCVLNGASVTWHQLLDAARHRRLSRCYLCDADTRPIALDLASAQTALFSRRPHTKTARVAIGGSDS